MRRVKLMGADPTCDQINDWFKIGTDVRVTTMPQSKLGGYPLDPDTGQAAVVNYRQICPGYKRQTDSAVDPLAYAQYYQQQEVSSAFRRLELVADDDDADGGTSIVSGMENVQDTMSIISSRGHGVQLPDGVTEQEAVGIYDTYNWRNHPYDRQLPITRYQQEILDCIESQQVTVIEGETGSGKTTQVAQYIFDEYAKRRRYCNIVITQPRRIAAVSIARRVCAERSWQLGRICGYQIELDRQCSEDTRLLYCTTGVLLQKLINDKNMHRFTHVILDEVHERDQDSDFCLLVARKLLWSNSPDVKVILMSATIESDLFASYFARPVNNRLEKAAVIRVEGRTYDVSEYYLEDLRQLGTLPVLDVDSPQCSKEAVHLAVRLIESFDAIEQSENSESGVRGSVLIFLPGLGEISDVDSRLRAIEQSHRLRIVPLHSSITGDEQAKVFDKPDSGQRKVILSTNIAESSITVPDVRFVIDFCLTKMNVCNSDTNYSSLQLTWASKANCRQRKGRAGRVAQGRCYRLVTYRFWHEQLSEYCVPEMQRSSLEQLVLKVKELDLGEPKAILALALSPPKLDDIERTIIALKEIGALASLSTGEVNRLDGELTFVGRVLSSLPVDIRLGKLMTLGHVFGVLDETIIISACQSLKSFFARPFKSGLEAYRHKLAWANNTYSDSLSYLNAYQTWKHQKAVGRFRLAADERNWGIQNFVQIRRIKDVDDLVEDLKRRLHRHNIFTPPRPSHRAPDVTMADSEVILKLVLCGAFYPYYFEQVVSDEVAADRQISGYNPCTTVMVKGLPANQGALYRQDLERLFELCDRRRKPRIHFEETRAFIEFRRDAADSLQTKILPSVYLALKLRHLPEPLYVDLIDADAARTRLEQLANAQQIVAGIRALRSNRLDDVSGDASAAAAGVQQPLIPLHTANVCLQVVKVVECGRFWAQRADAEASHIMLSIHTAVQQYVATTHQQSDVGRRLAPGDYCTAPYTEAGEREYYRARIESRTHTTAVVFFLDFGNTESVHVSELFDLPSSLLRYPFQVFECELCKVKPSAIKCPAGHWTEEARECFRQYMKKSPKCYATIFSQVHDVLRVDLFVKIAGIERHVNRELIRAAFADEAEESYLSHQSHQQREQAAQNPAAAAFLAVNTATPAAANLLPSTPLQRTGTKVSLRGPWSSYEASFVGCTFAGKMKPTRVERDSVNSIALCDEPAATTAQMSSLEGDTSAAGGTTPQRRMMVASCVNLNSTGSAFIVRDTTIMPAIPALLPLVALTFAPNAELRTDERRSRYTGALCGLGWDVHSEDGDSAYPDHDMELTFDSYFDLTDLQRINSVRMSINLALNGEGSADSMLKIQSKARQHLLELVKTRRDAVSVVPFHRPFRWRQLDLCDIRMPNVAELGGCDSVLYTLHCGIMLNEQQQVSAPAVAAAGDSVAMSHEDRLNHHLWLKSKASRSTASEEIECRLCDKLLHCPHDLLLHLASLTHRRNQPLA